MAYCVHCGVKLGDSERKCPLCQTPVYDPSEPDRKPTPKPYPVRTPEQELKRSKRFLLTIAAAMLLGPAALCLVFDLLLTGHVTWSGYATSALLLLFVPVAVALLARKYQLYYTMGAGFLSLNCYLFLVERLSQSGRWYFPIALPALTLGTLLVLIIVSLYRQGWLNILTVIAAAFTAVAVECLAVEWLISAAKGTMNLFVWSPFVLAPCLFISLSLFFINGSRPVREEVRRRLHF